MKLQGYRVITFCKALEFMTVFSTEMTEIRPGFDAKMTKITQSVIKLKLNNTRFSRHQSVNPVTKAAKLQIMIQGRRMSRTELARNLPAQANPGAKIATRTPVENNYLIY